MILSEYLSPMPGSADNCALVAELMSTKSEPWLLAMELVLDAGLPDEPLWATEIPANKNKANSTAKVRNFVRFRFIRFSLDCVDSQDRGGAQHPSLPCVTRPCFRASRQAPPPLIWPCP